MSLDIQFGSGDTARDLVPAGWLGQDATGAEPSFFGSMVDALPAPGVLSGWLVPATLTTSYVFRQEPRHG
jgi:hypothetical protein